MYAKPYTGQTTVHIWDYGVCWIRLPCLTIFDMFVFTHKQAGSKKAVQNESPVHVAIACTPPSPLVTNKAQAKRDGPTYLQAPVPPVSKVTVYVDLRQDIINTTADVQKFLCAVSKLKESMGGYESSLPNQNQSGL